MSDSPEKTREAELLEIAVSELRSISATLQLSEKRRRCNWRLQRIGQGIERLQELFPGRHRRFEETFDALDVYTNLTFSSAEDVEALGHILSLILSSVEQMGKDWVSQAEYQRHEALIREFLDELQTLDEGDPPGKRSNHEKFLRDYKPGVRDADRQAVRERALQRVHEAIDKSFAPCSDSAQVAG